MMEPDDFEIADLKDEISSLRSRVKQLEEAVEWAIEASDAISSAINSSMVEQFSIELRRRAGEKG